MVAVWLSEPRGRASLPDLVVYLDGHALMVDLTTNAELYVDRLAHAGLEVGHVRFKLSKKAGQRREERGETSEPVRAALPYKRCPLHGVYRFGPRDIRDMF